VRATIIVAALLSLSLSACKSQNEGAAAPEPAAAKPQPVAKEAPPAPAPRPALPPDSPLLNPDKLTEKAPDVYKVRLDTTQGPIVIEVHRDWSPNGADRFYNLVKNGFYDDTAFFRALPGFMNQFGIHGDPRVAAKWRDATIPDDPVKESNHRGYVTFAKSGMPNSRTTQIFINKRDNSNLDGMGFAPFGKVIEGMDHVDATFTGYGEGAPAGGGPNQGRVQEQGNAYLREQFPKLDWIKTARIE
jgi:peptidyl-prolyl cis-trans isomerase A (cyclophilin A)